MFRSQKIPLIVQNSPRTNIHDRSLPYYLSAFRAGDYRSLGFQIIRGTVGEATSTIQDTDHRDFGLRASSGHDDHVD